MDFITNPIFIALALGIIFLFLRKANNKSKLTKRYQLLAEQLGFMYSPNEGRQIIKYLEMFTSVKKHGWAMNILQGKQESLQILLFDYYPSKEHLSQIPNKVVFLESSIYTFPRFLLKPQGSLVDNVKAEYGFRSIQFRGNDKFSKKYAVEGEDEGKVRRLFEDEIIQAIENSTRYLTIEALGNQFLYSFFSENVEPQDSQLVIKEAKQIFELFAKSSVRL